MYLLCSKAQFVVVCRCFSKRIFLSIESEERERKTFEGGREFPSQTMWLCEWARRRNVSKFNLCLSYYRHHIDGKNSANSICQPSIRAKRKIQVSRGKLPSSDFIAERWKMFFSPVSVSSDDKYWHKQRRHRVVLRFTRCHHPLLWNRYTRPRHL